MIVVVSLAASMFLALSARLPQAPAAAEPAAGVLTRLEGQVLTSEGWPAEGATVTTSAGGRALTDADGGYRMDVRLPLSAERVQVRAVDGDGRGLTATTTVVLPAMPGTTNVGPLALLGDPCEPRWSPTFGGMPGVNNSVEALAVFDDGNGPALFLGGIFSIAGGLDAQHIARWDGASWSAVGAGVGGTIEDLLVFDDGTGPALFAAGSFVSAGGTPASRIAKWDGVSWSALGAGLNQTTYALAVYDDGDGPALYAAGNFDHAGGVPAKGIAKWNGSSWSALGAGLELGAVVALAVYDDGSGPVLCAGGTFERAGGQPSGRIAQWDGASWSPLASGIGTAASAVDALAVYDAGDGPRLYAGGAFSTAGGVSANRIARWDGASWSAVGTGCNGSVEALAVHDDGSGPALHASGQFTTAGGVPASRIAQWNGSSWSALGNGTSTPATAMTTFDDGDGPALYAGGGFTAAEGAALRIAKWRDSSWSALGNGLIAPVQALAVHDDGDGPALYAAGDFLAVGGVAANHIAEWNGTSWSALGSGASDTVRALAVYDDGSGPRLYAGGQFPAGGGAPASTVASWDGSIWAPLGGLSGLVNALAVYDDGSGPALYAGGGGLAGLTPSRIARWNGTSWTHLANGPSSTVEALVVHDDGSGPALYVAGDFDHVGGLPGTMSLARWNGTSWSSVGGGIGVDLERVEALALFDDGDGPALYAAGLFFAAGGTAASGIAKWDGESWSALGSGLTDPPSGPYPIVNSLSVFDDGSGPALYAGGHFETAGGIAANRIARWDGEGWSALGGGVQGAPIALVAYDDGGGPALFVGGGFVTVPDSGDSFLARFTGCPDSVPPTIHAPPVAFAFDRPSGPPGEVVTFSVTASDNLDPAPSLECVPPSGSSFPRGTTLVTCTATDAEGNETTLQFPVVVGPKWLQREF